jgi:uncharacterized Zn finger protein
MSVIICCPACGSPQGSEEAYLGDLGPRPYFRCRYCGFVFDTPVECEDPTIDIEDD